MSEATRDTTRGNAAAASAPARSGDLAQLGVGCQLESFPVELPGGPPSRKEPWSWYLRRRTRHLFIKLRRLAARLTGRRPVPASPSPAGPAPELRAGDLVRVRTAEYIRTTLDGGGAYRGCGFGSGMFQYCGKEFRVVKVVARFFDEGRGRMLKSRNLVLLDGVHCDGASSPDTLGCDRMCFYFWRTEWLEKVETPADGAEHGDRRAEAGT